jgi:hypothetical protein
MGQMGCSEFRVRFATLRWLISGVFDKCMRKVDDVHGGDESQLTARRQLIATRIMSLAHQGVRNPNQLEKRALIGLVPKHPY